MTLNPRDILSNVKRIESAIHNNEQLPIPVLTVRAKKALDKNPNDNTLKSLYGVLSKMAEHEQIFITRGEFKNLYDKFASYKTAARDYFAEELGVAEEAPVMSRTASIKADGGTDLIEQAYANSSDGALVNAFAEFWDEKGKVKKGGEYKHYDPKVASNASSAVTIELNRLGLSPKRIETFSGTKDFIICDAMYETSKGDSHVLIPVEVNKSAALFPSMFVSKHGLADLTKENIIAHVRETAGKNIVINSSTILDALSGAKKISSMSEMELQVMAAREHNSKALVKNASDHSEQRLAIQTDYIFLKEGSVDAQQSFGSQVPKEVINDSHEFEKKMASPKGVAEFTFGSQIINTARDLIVSKFRECGYPAQVAIASCDEDSLTFAARVDSSSGPFGFEVPVEIKNKRVNIPTVIAANDKLYDLTKEGLSRAVYEKVSNNKMIAKVSPMYDLKPSEVMARLRDAADHKNVVAAEEALMVLAEIADARSYSNALSEYMRSLNPNNEMKKEACNHSRCSRIVTSSTHSVPLCGHLNLPLDKVYQDKHGDCIPLYRKAMAENYEGMTFITSKIFNQ